jgi:hypothetical protein
VLEEREARLVARSRHAEALVRLFAEHPRREGELEIEHAREGRLDLGEVVVGEALLLEELARLTWGRPSSVLVPETYATISCDLRLGVAEVRSALGTDWLTILK